MRTFTTDIGVHGAVLECYVQEPSSELRNATTRPAVLIFPGGGYVLTSDREAEPIALAYAAKGFQAFVLRYSVGPQASAQMALDDARAALAWVVDEAPSLHTDADRVVVVGFSAGGHLASSLVATGPRRPQALVVGYPIVLAEFGRHLGKDILNVPDHVDAQMPPTFVFSTRDDTLVPVHHTVALVAALEAAGVPFETHIYMEGPHGLSLAVPATADGVGSSVQPAVARWFEDSVRFITSILGDFPVVGAPDGFAGVQARRTAGPDMPLRSAVTDPRMRPVLDRVVPQVVVAAEQDVLVAALSLRQLVDARPGLVDQAAVTAVAAELGSL